MRRRASQASNVTIALIALAVLVVRDVLRPERDDVRLDDPAGDDPAGGILSGLPDRWTLRRVPSREVPPVEPAVPIEPAPETPADVRA